MYVFGQYLMSCTPLSRAKNRKRETGGKHSASSHRDPMSSARNTRDLDWALQELQSGNMTLHDISLYRCQPTSGSFQETENSMSINISKTKEDSRYFSQFLSLLTSENTCNSLKNLEFHCVDWEQQDLQCLHLLLDDNNHIKQLVFHRNTFTTEGLFELSEILGKNKAIQVLIFFECQIGSLGAGFLASALRANETLTELQIWEDSIGSKGAEEFSKMIEINSTLRLLIILDNNSITATPVISAILARNRTMEVHIWNRDDEDRRSKVVEFAPENSALRIYRLDPSGLRRATIALGWNSTVKTLDMTGVRLNSKWAKEFRRVMENNSSLKSIILSKTCLRDKSVVYIAAGLFKNQTLEHLQLDGNLFSGVGLEYLLCPLTRFSALLNQANITLKSIVFGGEKTKIARYGTTAILQMLETNQTIVSLGIYNDTSLKPCDIIKIFRSIERNASLRHLSLRNCRGVEGELVLQTIMETLQINPWIEEIDLSGTPLEKANKTEAVYQKLGQNGETKQEKDPVCDLPLTTPSNCRVFLCGQESAGKTTLCHSLYSNFSSIKLPNWSEIRSIVNPVDRALTTPEIKIKCLQDDDIKISVWELPGQQEFYTLHDVMFPGTGSPSFFLIITSLFKKSSSSESKSLNEIEEDIVYWLRFIVSNSRRSQPQCMLPNVTVVFTHFDKISHESEKLQPIVNSVDRLRDKFEGYLEFYPTIFAVDGRSSSSVIKLAHHLRKTSKTILERVPRVFKLCEDVIKTLADWRLENHNKPVIKWSEFRQLCQLRIPALRIRSRQGDMEMELRRRAIANSMHHVGEVIFFEDLGFIILDFDWFYGELLIRLIKLKAGKNLTERNGLVSKKELEKILQGSLQSQIPGLGSKVLDNLETGDLIRMMLRLELCYEQNPGNPESLLLIPETLEEGRGRTQRWQLSTSECIYVGRHMECDDSSHMILTRGFFPRLQVHLHNKLLRSSNQHSMQYSLEKYLISVIINGIHVRVELGGKLEHHIDILVCSTKSSTEILRLCHQFIIPAIHSLCHGVSLTESIIRPDCVKHLIPPRYRNDQSVPVQQLKQALLSVPAESMYDYQHAWKSISDGSRLILPSGLNYGRDLLSDDELREVLHRRYYDLHHLATELAMNADNNQDQNQASRNEADFAVEPSLSGIAKGVEAILQKLKIIENEIKDIKQEIQGLRYYEHRLLIELHRKVDYLVNYNIQLEERKFPQMFYFVRIENFTKILVTRIFSGMTALRLHMLCEYRGEMHVVEDQIGCELMQVDNLAVRNLLPYISGFMKLLTFALKIGAHFVAGMGEMIPDLSREVAHLVSSPVVYGTAAMAAGAIGATAMGQFVENRTRSRNMPVGINGSRNIKQDMVAARQWLIDFLKDQRISSGKAIAQRFGLWRVRYRDDGQIAWICRRHCEMRANEVIEVPTGELV